MPRHIKILQLITSINVGGAENIAITLSENKDPNSDFILTEIFPSYNEYAKNKKEELKKINIRVRTLTQIPKRLSLIIAPASLFILLLKEKPDIVHSHTDIPDFVLSASLKLLTIFGFEKPRIVRTIHNTQLWPTYPRIGKLVETSFKNDCVIGVSEASLEAYNNLRKVSNLFPSQNQKVIFNGCRKPVQSPISLGIDKGKINIAFCGRFEYQKGIDILMERIDEINKKYFNEIHFYIIGSGTFNEVLQDWKKQHNNVFISSPISNVSNKLWAFDFLIMPSRFEGLVLLSLEASFAKVPVIAAKAPGLSETLPGDWPLFFDLEDPDSLLRIINKITRREYDLVLLKKRALGYVSSKFKLEGMIEAYSNLYVSEYNNGEN